MNEEQKENTVQVRFPVKTIIAIVWLIISGIIIVVAPQIPWIGFTDYAERDQISFILFLITVPIAFLLILPCIFLLLRKKWAVMSAVILLSFVALAYLVATLIFHYTYVGFTVLPVVCVPLVLIFVDRENYLEMVRQGQQSQEIEQRNIDEADDSQSEPEQTIDTHDGKEVENENIRKIYLDKGQTKRENKNGIGVDSSSPDSQWLTKFESIRSQTDSILNKVTAASTSTEEEISVALNEAIEKLSILLQTMKETSEPSKKEHQKYKKDVLAGMELFIKGCQDNIEWFKTRQERSLTECSANISMAYGKFNKANIWLAKGSE